MTSRLFVLACFAWAAVVTSAAADVVVSTCGTTVPAGATGRLTADVDCSATSVGGVFLDDGATLDLAGFTLRGNPSAPFGTHGVTCGGSCTVLGPGSIQDFSTDGLYAATGSVRIRGAGFVRNRFRGIEAFLGRVRLLGALFYGNSGESVYTGAPVNADGCTFASNGGGISGGLGVKVIRSTFFNNSVAVNAGRATVRDSTFKDNGISVQGYRSYVKDCDITGGGIGVNGRYVRVVSTQITGSVLDGIDAVRLRILRSTVTGSGSACSPPYPCADLATQEAPSLLDTVCDRSIAWQTHLPWGVCTLD